MNETSKQEIESYMKQYHVDYASAEVTPTICALFGLEPPEEGGRPFTSAVIDQASHLMNGEGNCQKALIFCPDAVGDIHYQKHPELISRIDKSCDFKFKGTVVMPSVTPVSFATIFSGASPQLHGIQVYSKPVLTIRTLFDVLSEAGKKVAIVAINTCSIDTIFRKRKIEYFSTVNDENAYQRTLKLIQEDYFDVIISYQTDFDHQSHLHGPDSPEALAQLNHSVEYAEGLIAATDKHWAKYNRVFAVTPDHGNHETSPGKGGHGENIYDDMVVNHFYRIRGAN